jgi:uncharacterized protein
LSCAISR